MSSHPDADAFVAAILRDPAEVTTRLAFADWLEETGDPSDAAWAHFIRQTAAAQGHLLWGEARRELGRRVAGHATKIRARLTVPADVFIRHPRHLLQFLPPSCFTAALSGFEAPGAVLELVPESVAYENLILPLAAIGRDLLAAVADPHDGDVLRTLQFILNRDVIAVRAGVEDVRAAITRCYGEYRYETSIGSVLTEFPAIESGPSATLTRPPPAAADYLGAVLFTAEQLRAELISFTPRPDGVRISYRTPGGEIDAERISHPRWADVVLPEVVRLGEATGPDLVVEVVRCGRYRAARIRRQPVSFL